MLGTSKILPNGKRAWALNSTSFEQLLAEFDADRNSAGTAYEQLRLRLIHFFEWHGCAFSEELADETFDRAARRLSEGEFVKSLPSYCFGVARRLLMEVLGQQCAQPPFWMPKNSVQSQKEHWFHVSAQLRSGESQFREFQFACLEASLHQLPPADRELVLHYYDTDAYTRIDQRAALAERLGVSLNALRVRVHRVREELKRHFFQQLQHGRVERGAVAHQRHKGC
jgi:DNA-directed RNA polymerase specialized sigma24 family protein